MKNTIEQSALPAIGSPVAGGLFAGISRGEEGQPDAALILLPDAKDESMTWQEATDWAASLGDDARLPTRNESALLYAHLRDQFEPRWHWTSTESQYSANYAFIQFFEAGDQRRNHKGFSYRARAVRRLLVIQ